MLIILVRETTAESWSSLKEKHWDCGILFFYTNKITLQFIFIFESSHLYLCHNANQCIWVPFCQLQRITEIFPLFYPLKYKILFLLLHSKKQNGSLKFLSLLGPQALPLEDLYMKLFVFLSNPTTHTLALAIFVLQRNHLLPFRLGF